MPDSNIYTHQSIAKSIFDHEVETIFGLIGDANIFLVDYYVHSCGGKFVPAAYEGGAVLMALAHAYFSNQVGIASVTHGPALTNCVTALIEGARGRIPMVLLAGDTPVMASNHLQKIDQHAVTNITGAGFEQLRSPETSAADFAHAFYRASDERRPIVLNIPAEFMWEETKHKKVVLPTISSQNSVLEGGQHEAAIGMLASARRPLILAGRGARSAKSDIIDLAKALEAPLATTLRAKALFDSHENDIGIFGTLSTPAAYEIISKSDLIISFGASLSQFTTDQGKLLNQKRVIQVNLDKSDITKNYHPDAGLNADAALTAKNMLYWLREAEVKPTGFSKEIDKKAIKIHQIPKNLNISKGCIDYHYALKRFDEALPKNRILATDAGRFMTEVWCLISVPDSNSFFAPTNFGSIGLGLQSAIGICSSTERPVILFTGDGGFMMGGINEFNTAVRQKQNLIVVVANDSAYGAEYIQFRDRRLDPTLSEFEWPSFADMATAMGGRGYYVSSNEELEVALKAIESMTCPLLIELKLDPEHMPRMRT